MEVLDGHVMLVSTGTDSQKLAIASYALGGSPFSGYPAHPNPIPAGSADGNAMLFFYEDKRARLRYAKLSAKAGETFDASKVVVTTNLHSALPPLDGYVARSYTFSVTSNTPFQKLADLHPTLVLHYDQQILPGIDGELRIGRYDPTKQSWDLLDTHNQRASFFVAASLEKLYRRRGRIAEPSQADHFRLFLKTS